jgi:hypothetical protein
MIKSYTFIELAELDYPPRYIVSLYIYEYPLVIGFNNHYSLDSNHAEMLADFFAALYRQHPTAKFDINDLEIELADIKKLRPCRKKTK